MPNTTSGTLTVKDSNGSILFTIKALSIAYTDQTNGYKAEFFCTDIDPDSCTLDPKFKPYDKPVTAQLNNGTLLHGAGVKIEYTPANHLSQTSAQFNVYIKALPPTT